MGILVVEDSPQQAQLLLHILNKNGFSDVMLVESAAAAFEALSLHDPGKGPDVDLILMDLLLPEMDGIEACRTILRTEHLRKVPIVMVTADPDPRKLQSAFHAGAVDYIVKPVRKIELLARVGSVLKMRRQEEALRKAQEDLRKINDELEKRVAERTLELQDKTLSLEEANTALKILLRRREEDKEALEEAVLSNVKSSIAPHIEKLKTSRLNATQMNHVKILEKHLKRITSPFVKRISQSFLGLTSMEVRIAELIREGSSTKEIAVLMGRSESTVLFHRDNIRTKLGLKEKKTNLKSYLRSLE